MRKYLLVIAVVLGLTGIAIAQKPAQPPPATPPPPGVAPCPTVSITGPNRSVAKGETIRYTARIDTKEQPLNIEFKWSINPETVFAGQGGSEIEFERPAGNSLTVSLEILGAPETCPRNASETSNWDPGPVARRLDQFVGPSAKISDLRVKRIADRMRNEPSARLYIVLEHITDEAAPAARQKAQMIASLLLKSGLEAKRVTYVIGKTPRERVQFWLVPAGAEYPKIEK